MSWLFSQALVAAYSEENCSGGAPSVQSNGTVTPPAYLLPDRMTDSWSRFPSGMTCEPLTASRGEELLTWFLAASRAKTCPRKPPCITESTDSTVSEADSGKSLPASWAKYDPATHSLRTRQFLLFEDSTECCATLPRWGTMQAGDVLERTPPAWITNANESGLLPTVLATDWKGGTTAMRKDRGDLRTDQWRDYVKIKHGLTYPHPTHSELRMGWPEGWTELAALGTDKFQAWQRLHGKL
jgi:hypothetical protein